MRFGAAFFESAGCSAARMEKAFVGWELGLISEQDPRVPQQPLLAAAETAAYGAATRGGEAAAAAPRGEAEPRSAGAQRPASSPPARATSPERWGPRRGRRAAALRRAWPFREIACPRPRKRAHNRGNTRILSPRMGFEARLHSVARSAQYRQSFCMENRSKVHVSVHSSSTSWRGSPRVDCGENRLVGCAGDTRGKMRAIRRARGRPGRQNAGNSPV
jgi:hypothetical protein